MAKHNSGELRCPATALIYFVFSLQAIPFLCSCITSSSPVSVTCDVISLCSHLARTSAQHITLVKSVVQSNKGMYVSVKCDVISLCSHIAGTSAQHIISWSYNGTKLCIRISTLTKTLDILIFSRQVCKNAIFTTGQVVCLQLLINL